jgi:Raf kinase inhibitor-like YbhB/YbcL family protein
VGPQRLLAAGLAAAALTGCGGGKQQGSATPVSTAPDVIGLSTPAFHDGARIPVKYTCSGAGTAPALVWKDVPDGAVELALVVEDPDAPGGTFVHWTAWSITPQTRGLVPEGGQFTTGTKQGANSAGKTGWTPPCPPKGDKPHHYVFTLYALKKPAGLDDGAQPDAVRAALSSAIARGSFTGTFGR